MVDFVSQLASSLHVYGLLIGVGVLVFVLWGAAKAAAHQAGIRFGWAAVAAVVLLLGLFFWVYVGLTGLGELLALIGAVAFVLSLLGGRR